MKFIPILFSTPMVQAQRAGNKTMTRRTKGLENVNIEPDFYIWLNEYPQDEIPRQAIPYDTKYYYAFTGKHNNSSLVFADCPYGKPGDILWVRETFRKYYFVDEAGYIDYDKVIVDYAADNPERIPLINADGFQVYNKNGTEKFIPWKPSLFMPKSACRTWLEITSIRPERLHDISESDARHEGVSLLDYGDETIIIYQDYMWNSSSMRTAKASFETLWQSINGEQSWNANPWVWVIAFKSVEKPAGFC